MLTGRAVKIVHASLMNPGDRRTKSSALGEGGGSICEHCGRIFGHQPWCLTRNAAVTYAFAAALDMCELTPEDRLYLHALGVSWPSNAGNTNR